MYVPRPDAPRSERECWDFVRAQGFGHLIAPGEGRDLPVVVATQYVVAEPGVVVLHLATPNPVWAALAERPRALLSVAGDWAYLPSDRKVVPGEDPLLGIPTTYYAAVQLSCDVEVVDDAGAKAAVLRTQLDALQPGIPVADPSVHTGKLPGIRGLRLTVTDVRGKFKYGGNVDEEHRQVAADYLRGNGNQAALEHLTRRSSPDRA